MTRRGTERRGGIGRAAAGRTAVFVVAACLLHEFAPLRAQPTRTLFKDRADFESAAFTSYPFFRIIAEQDPQRWTQFVDDNLALDRHSGGQLTPEVAVKLTALVQPLRQQLYQNAARAHDGAVLGYLRASEAFEKSVQATSPEICAAYISGGQIPLATLSAESTAAFQGSLESLAEAYRDGRSAPIPPPNPALLQSLFHKAAVQSAHPLSVADLNVVGRLATSDPVAACDVWTRLIDNILALPTAEAAALTRGLIGP